MSPAPVSNYSITFLLDENCMSMLMEDVGNFLQQSQEQASPLDTTRRFQSADNSGYQASPTKQKPPLIGSSSMIHTSPLLGGSSGFPIKPKAIPQATPACVECSSDVGSSAFTPILQPGTSQMGSQTSIASASITVPDGKLDTVQEDLMKQILKK